MPQVDDFLPVTDMPVDAGIRNAVCILRRAGVETFESCEGGPGHAFDVPTIRFHGNAWTGHKAFAVAMEHGLPVRRVQRAYAVVNGELEGPVWEIVFYKTPVLLGGSGGATTGITVSVTM